MRSARGAPARRKKKFKKIKKMLKKNCELNVGLAMTYLLAQRQINLHDSCHTKLNVDIKHLLVHTQIYMNSGKLDASPVA